MRLRRYSFLLVSAFCSLFLWGQNGYVEYIEQYKGMAIDQMHRHGIPASITMAQALLESGAGRSTLAVRAKNHFGIKTGGVWNGPYFLHDDDERNERFRVYESVAQSYEDHSLFLKKPRYSRLFSLDSKDYRGWAVGLKAAGYATNPAYAQRLIDIIDRFNLAQLDYVKPGANYNPFNVFTETPKPANTTMVAGALAVRKCNDSYFVVAREGDTYLSIAVEMNTKERRLRKYNEVGKRHHLQAGEVVYLTKKQKQTNASFAGKYHLVAAGESLHSISQLYGVQMKTLYLINHLSKNYIPTVGDQILLR